MTYIVFLSVHACVCALFGIMVRSMYDFSDQN